MEISVSLLIAIIGCVIGVASFFFNRKDKSESETKEEASKQSIISYRLDELSKKVDKILNKLDNQESFVRDICKEEIEKHVLKFHDKDK